MDGLREMLKGKKTYLAALGAVIAAVIGFAEGASLMASVQLIVTAVLGVTIRAGISKK